MALFQAMKDNIINMTRTMHGYEDQIKELKDKLVDIQSQGRKQSSAGDDLEGFRECALETYGNIFQAHQSLYLQI